jgi:O-antigen/teichoic acid export membrane protein
MLRTVAANLILRGMTLASKFLLLLSLARYLPPEELGVWGIITATIALALFFLGLDFYAFNTREILASDRSRWPGLIRDQLVFHGVIYVMVLPLLLTVFLSGIISWQYIGFFYALLILEHLSQESFRLLITLHKSSLANAVLFLRSGSWVYAVMVVWIVFDTGRDLTFIWIGWSSGVVASLALTVFALKDLPWRQVSHQPVDWAWLRNGTRVCLPFFLATIAIMGVQYIDRYFIQYYHGDAMVGIYTFFISIGNLVHVFVFTAITMVLQPRIVKAFRKGEISEYRRCMRTLTWGTVAGVLVLVGIVSAGIKPVLMLVNRPIYGDHLSVFWILLAAVAVLTCSHIPNYALYARMYDRAIIVSALLAFGTALVACALLVPRYGIHGAAFATLIGVTVLGLSRLTFLLKMGPAASAHLPSADRVEEPEEVIP